MKRLFAVIIVLALSVTCFSACGKEEDEPEYIYTPAAQTKDEIFEKAEKGILSPVSATDANGNTSYAEVTLFMLRDDLVNIFSEDNLHTSNGERYNCISTGDVNFYFLSENMDNGVVAMVDFESVYDFDLGTSVPDDVISRLGEPAERSDKSDDDLWFMPYSAGVTADCLTYYAEDNTLSFYFIGGFLSMTSLSVTKLW